MAALAEQLPVPVGYAESGGSLPRPLAYFRDTGRRPRPHATLTEAERVHLAIARFEHHPRWTVLTANGDRYHAPQALTDLRARGARSPFLRQELRTADLVLQAVDLSQNPTPFETPIEPPGPPGPPRARVLDLSAEYGDLIAPSVWRKDHIFPSPPAPAAVVQRVRRPSHADFAAALRAGPHQVITGLGHGRDDRFFGAEQADLLNARKRLPDLQGAIVHLLSCRTARELGPELLTRGRSSAFFGYANDFRYVPEHPEHFWRADASIARALVAGYDVEDVLRIATRAYLDEAQALTAACRYCCASTLLDNLAALRLLQWNAPAKA